MVSMTVISPTILRGLCQQFLCNTFATLVPSFIYEMLLQHRGVFQVNSRGLHNLA